MSKYETQEEVERRASFYTSEQVKKYLKKYGVPKGKVAMRALIELGYPNPDPETIESMGHVHFDIHPQQINIRDKANESLIISIKK